MTTVGNYPVGTTSSTEQPQSPQLLQAPLPEKHLDAALLAVVRRRKLEPSVLPGVPFH